MTDRTLLSAAEVFDALDGIEGVMKLTGGKYNAVMNWKYANRFPSRTYVQMTAALHERSCRAPAALWGMAEPAVAVPEQVRA
jgi:hypothetical protein